MNDDITERQKSPGRTFRIGVAGDTADEIELAALDAAREFFGPDRQIEVRHDYAAMSIGPHDRLAPTGKKYSAEVVVCTVEP